MYPKVVSYVIKPKSITILQMPSDCLILSYDIKPASLDFDGTELHRIIALVNPKGLSVPRKFLLWSLNPLPGLTSLDEAAGCLSFIGSKLDFLATTHVAFEIITQSGFEKISSALPDSN